MKTVMLASALFLQANADDAPTIFGLGVNSCATVMAENTYAARASWILGYWSGLNSRYDGPRDVGSSTDARGIVGEVENQCNQHPSWTLVNATLFVFTSLMVDRR